jgi:hypothetical protein
MSGNKPMYTDAAPLTDVITVTVIAVVCDHCSDYLGSIKYINWLKKWIKKGLFFLK